MFRADIANTIFGHFIAAISGGNLYRKSSFLLDALGQPVFPEHITISERPHLKKALASSAFDSEGVETIDREIIKQGQLETYLLTSYSARKLGLCKQQGTRVVFITGRLPLMVVISMQCFNSSVPAY